MSAKCPGSGMAADWTAGKVRCPVCRAWVWGHLIAHNLAWTSVHRRPR